MDASATIVGGIVVGLKDKESMVDPFLVEALQNPRHRLTSKYLFFLPPQISCCKPQILILFHFLHMGLIAFCSMVCGCIVVLFLALGFMGFGCFDWIGLGLAFSYVGILILSDLGLFWGLPFLWYLGN